MIKPNKKISTKEGTNLTSNIQPLIFDHRGITLVALIITIIVMLILVGVSISIAINGGLFDITKRAVRETENAKNIEQQLANGRVKIDGTWYDSIEDYVGGNESKDQTEPEKPEEPVTPPEEKVIPQIGDYVLYEPDTVSSPYSLAGTESGKGTYDSSTTPNTFSTPEDQSIAQEKLQWQVLKVYDNGVIDLIGTPTTGTIGFGGWLGYNNGVYLLNDICKELYSKPSKGITARSVNIEDFEDESNGGSWKSARDSYTNGEEVEYGHKKTYTDANSSWYPNLYAEENGSGIGTTTVKTNGIGKSENYYTRPTTETYGKANSTGLTATNTFYAIQIDETNYGTTAKVLSQTNVYWLASRSVYCQSVSAGFCLNSASSVHGGGYMLLSDGGVRSTSRPLRPVVTLGSGSQLSLKTEGTDGAPSTYEITKY